MFLLAAMLAPDARGQSWRLTTEVVMPAQGNNAAQVLLDTLLQMGRRSDTLRMRRSREDPLRPVSEIENQLIEEGGLAPGNANLAYVSYRFEDGEDGFRQTITKIQYQYVRGGLTALRRGEAGTMTEVLYIDGEQRWFQRILQQKGMVPGSEGQEEGEISIRNELVTVPFTERLSFARLAQGGDMDVTQVSGQTVRGNRDEVKGRILQELYRLVYQ